MTYCLAISLKEGLVFCSDSRTNAGPDRVSTYSKMHPILGGLRPLPDPAQRRQPGHQPGGDRPDPARPGGGRGSSIFSRPAMSPMWRTTWVKSASASRPSTPASSAPVARARFQCRQPHLSSADKSRVNPQALYLIYPEGNHITASEHCIRICRSARPSTASPSSTGLCARTRPTSTAMRCALVSMDSTIRSNATVGPPLECLYLPQRFSLKALRPLLHPGGAPSLPGAPAQILGRQHPPGF